MCFQFCFNCQRVGIRKNITNRISKNTQNQHTPPTTILKCNSFLSIYYKNQNNRLHFDFKKPGTSFFSIRQNIHKYKKSDNFFRNQALSGTPCTEIYIYASPWNLVDSRGKLTKHRGIRKRNSCVIYKTPICP